METRKIKVYISGPISGMTNWNRPAFDAMKERLTKAGFEPISPLDGVDPKEEEKPYVEYMVAALKLLDKCDAIIGLPGWTKSYGAYIERIFAMRERKEVLVDDGVGCIRIDSTNTCFRY